MSRQRRGTSGGPRIGRCKLLGPTTRVQYHFFDRTHESVAWERIPASSFRLSVGAFDPFLQAHQRG